MHAEVLNLAAIITTRTTRSQVMPVGAADSEDDRAVAEPPCLALDARQALAVVDHEVVTRVLSERDQDRVAALS